jgi:hypothetical protein
MKPWEKDYASEDGTKPWERTYSVPEKPSPKKLGTLGNIAAGAVRGAGSIGATILSPIDAAARALGIENSYIGRNDRRQAMTEGLQSLGADPSSLAFQGGKLGTEIAGTAGAGGAIAQGVRGISQAPKALQFANSVASGGFKTGGAPGLANAANRVAGGVVSGGAMAGLVDPKDAGTGALIGGAMPPAVKVAGEAGKLVNKAGKAIASKVAPNASPAVSPEVSALYQKAKSLGIDVPIDRIIDNRPLNAAAASLNYVPMSGRMATEDKMISQFNKAVSRSFGQNSDNVTQSVRKASIELGKRFDDTLKSTTLNLDNQFLNDLGEVEQLAIRELDPMQAKVITNQIEVILGKGGTGQIDGQTAYNIKKTLDRIGNRNSNDAWYARELKKKLMGALNRSMPAQDAADFAKLRQQYGNMLDIEGIAQNGAEGGVSIARLANMKNINNPELQDLADIASQFLKTRESPHGAAQRVVLGGLGAVGLGGGAATGTLPLVAGAMAAGRAGNTALNSRFLKNALADKPEFYSDMLNLASDPLIRSLPVVGGTGLLNYP